MNNTNVPSANSATGLRRLIDFQPGEGRLVAWAFLYLFAVFSSYYVIRPIRDEMGLAGGVSNLSWLFTGTLVAMMAVNPLGWSGGCRAYVSLALHTAFLS